MRQTQRGGHVHACGGDVLVAGRATNGPARDASPSPIPASYRCRPLAAAASQPALHSALHCNALKRGELPPSSCDTLRCRCVAVLCRPTAKSPPSVAHRPIRTRV